MLPLELIHLPLELLSSIINMIPSLDLLHLRQTCKYLNSILAPVVFRSLSGESYFTDEKRRGFLIATANNSQPNLATYVRNIEFKPSPPLGSPTPSGSLGSPVPSGSLGSPVPSGSLGSLVPSGSQENGNETKDMVSEEKAMESEEVIVKYLVPFVEKLVNVNRVTWEYRSNCIYNPELYLQNLTSALAKLPSLKELSITISRYSLQDPLPDLSGFNGLHSLEVNLDMDSGTKEYLKSSVMPAIAASPKLKRLHLTVGDIHYSGEIDIWRADDSEPTGTTSYLQDLKLVNVPVKLSSSHARRVFRNLKHLTLLYLIGWEQQNILHGISWVEIWKELTEAGNKEDLWLETLDTCGIQSQNGLSALVQYLVTHPGLKRLSICRPPYTEGPRQAIDSDEEDYSGSLEEEIEENLKLATLFWTEIIPRSAHSLRELTIDSLYEGPWSYGPDASNALSQCTRLRKLFISVSGVPGEWAKAKAANFKLITSSATPRDAQEVVCSSSQGVNCRDALQSVSMPWGQLETTPLLLASDLANMKELQEVIIRLAPQDLDYDWISLDEMEDRETELKWATQMLNSFVPWEGYPHILGDNGIVRIQD